MLSTNFVISLNENIREHADVIRFFCPSDEKTSIESTQSA